MVEVVSECVTIIDQLHEFVGGSVSGPYIGLTLSGTRRPSCFGVGFGGILKSKRQLDHLKRVIQ